MEQSKYKWKRLYTLVLAANALYIIIFHLIMQAF